LIEQEGLDPHGLQLEITENSLLRNFEETRSLLLELKSQGFGLALDDFGTGYSSLSYLARYPFDTIKIDRSFVRDIDSDPGLTAIVKGIVLIARNLNLEIVAEGIETQEQYNRFAKMGCCMVQGWYLNPALPEDQWLELLRKEYAPVCS
jgi:EAL domain-containing protein (putative c-di-GMP-specific phosphodiesterase class I)